MQAFKHPRIGIFLFTEIRDAASAPFFLNVIVNLDKRPTRTSIPLEDLNQCHRLTKQREKEIIQTYNAFIASVSDPVIATRPMVYSPTFDTTQTST